jgi:hypothetical protein
MRRARRFILVMGGVAVSTAALTSGVLASRTAQEQGPGAVVRQPSPLRAVPPELADVMPVFAREQRPSDLLAGDPVAALNEYGDWRPGENPLLARRIVAASGDQAHLWPMRDGVCYSSAGPAGCVPLGLLRDRGVIVATSSTSDSSTVQVFGLAIEGIDSVELSLADGGTVSAPVKDGAFYVEASNDPAAAGWINPDGTRGSQDQLLHRPS